MDQIPATMDTFGDRPLSWRASETVRELDDRPSLLTKIEIRGRSFPHLDAQPFVRVSDREGSRAQSWFADVADDASTFSGYFAVDAAIEGGVIEWGYGNRVFGRLDGFDPGKIERLDRNRLPPDLVVMTEALLARRLGLEAPRVPRIDPRRIDRIGPRDPADEPGPEPELEGETS